MSEEAREPSIAFSGVLLSSDGVAMLDGDRVVRHLPRDDSQILEVRRGFLSAHPLVQCALGAVLFWVGLMPIKYVIVWFRDGGAINLYIALLAVLPGAPAPRLIRP